MDLYQDAPLQNVQKSKEVLGSPVMYNDAAEYGVSRLSHGLHLSVQFKLKLSKASKPAGPLALGSLRSLGIVGAGHLPEPMRGSERCDFSRRVLSVAGLAS